MSIVDGNTKFIFTDEWAENTLDISSIRHFSKVVKCKICEAPECKNICKQHRDMLDFRSEQPNVDRRIAVFYTT